MPRILLLITIAAALVFSGLEVNARRAKAGDMPPKALLVILKTRKGQVEYLTKHRPEHLPRLKRDIRGAMAATVNDFNDHFDYCPVFFFADTMATEIMAAHFDGVLLDRNLKPVQQTVLAEGDTSFFVADFGHMSQALSKDDATAQMNVNLREVLLVMDYHFELLKWPLPAFARGFISTSSMKYRNYWYRSEYYEIDYTPQAAAYSLTLQRYYKDVKKPASK